MTVWINEIDKYNDIGLDGYIEREIEKKGEKYEDVVWVYEVLNLKFWEEQANKAGLLNYPVWKKGFT